MIAVARNTRARCAARWARFTREVNGVRKIVETLFALGKSLLDVMKGIITIALETLKEVIQAAIEVFGVERAMFASNFPVDGLCASFDEIYSGFDEVTRGFAEGERHALFHDNAERIYRMEQS